MYKRQVYGDLLDFFLGLLKHLLALCNADGVIEVDNRARCALAPVSYTHLDVYKRQSTWPASIGPPLTNTVGTLRRAAAIKRPGTFLSQFGTMTSASKPCANAVSYTHLDVYKRQPLTSAKN